MVKIESYDGKKKDIGCIGCAIESGEADLRGIIVKTRHFHVGQDYQNPIPGFFIVATRKHIISLAEFSEEQQAEFIRLVCGLRKGMKDILGIKDVCIFQNEDNPYHFHLWILPKMKWMEGRVEAKSLKSILDYAKQNMKTEQNLRKVDDAVRKMTKYMQEK